MAAVVTKKGLEVAAFRMIGAPAAGTEPKNLGWGTGAFTAAQSDVAPFIEASEARVAGTSSQVTTTTTNDTYQVVGTITAAGAKTITEVLLSDASAKPVTASVAAGGVVGSAVATTLNTSAAFSPGNGNYIQIRTEVMQVTAGSGTTALTVVRGQNGSSAISTIAVSDTVTGGNPPGQTGITSGNVFVHADHSAFALNPNDSIQYTVQVKFA